MKCKFEIFSIGDLETWSINIFNFYLVQNTSLMMFKMEIEKLIHQHIQIWSGMKHRLSDV